MDADAPEPESMQTVGYHAVDPDAASDSGRDWWDANASEYLEEHGAFLGGADFVWCPEGLREEDARLLGDVRGARVLEVGAGAAQCSRWLVGQGVEVVATDVAHGMLRAGLAYDESAGLRTPLVVADARALPFPDDSFDVAFTAYGAIPFVPDADRIHREVARVLRPGGRWVFSVTHPVRWAFPDDPGEAGLTAARPYFDRRPYVEIGESGRVLYAEFHRTLGDHVRELADAGFVLERLVEPEWRQGHDAIWGGWSPLRGALLPGTAIFVTHLGPG
ncbi:MAG: methyltransferase domain-containing protein [Brevundimonas sp.]